MYFKSADGMPNELNRIHRALAKVYRAICKTERLNVCEGTMEQVNILTSY
jgi:hypothetical protein